jgi:hypothetical protein
MSIFRRLPTRTLVLALAAFTALAAAAAAGAMVALGGSGPKPDPLPLPQAIHDALAAPLPEGVTARIKFTNHLFPDGSLEGVAGSPLMSGASGRLWLANDGRFRLELQSDGGDSQIVSDGKTVSLYDAQSNTVYRGAASTKLDPAGKREAPTLAQIGTWLSDAGRDALFSAAQPDSIAGQPAYTVDVSPRHDGGLLGSVSVSWDASRGVPLRIAVTAQGDSSAVLELAVTDISYGAVAAGDLNVAPPAGAKVVELASKQRGHEPAKPEAAKAEGVDAVQAELPFTLAAPATLVGLPRTTVRSLDWQGKPTALVVYGQGLGALVVVEQQAEPDGGAGVLGSLPAVSVNGATGHELDTALGTILQFQRNGVATTLLGSVPPTAAETAARELG